MNINKIFKMKQTDQVPQFQYFVPIIVSQSSSNNPVPLKCNNVLINEEPMIQPTYVTGGLRASTEAWKVQLYLRKMFAIWNKFE